MPSQFWGGLDTPVSFWAMSPESQAKAAHNLTARVKAQKLMDQGYRRVSNKHCIISRVDRADWKRTMAAKHAPWSYSEGVSWVSCLGVRAADHYRRCHSKDTLTISEEISRYVGTSSGDPIGFMAQIATRLQPKEESEMLGLHKFKIHGAETVSGEKHSNGSSKFYDTYREAEEAAKRCVTRDGCEIVIFEAIKVVKALTPPMVVEDITKSGL